VAAEPINIFAHKQDLAAVASLLRQLASGANVLGPDAAWERITIGGSKSWFRKAPVLTLKNVPEYYSGAGWPQQLAGMRNYFSGFPDVPCKPDILRLIQSFRLALATEFDPDLFIESNDSRLQFLFAATKHLDGVLFTPSGLWDASGRVLIDADGRCDPEAVMPQIPESSEPVSITVTEADYEVNEEERTPPDVKRVTRRMLCLVAVSGRGLLEAEQMPREQAETERRRLMTWVGELALESELEPQELAVLQRPVGTLSPQETVDVTWRLEGLGVLAWALGQFDLPPYDQLVDPGELLPAAGFLDLNQATRLLASTSLRSTESLRELQDQCFALHWRLRNFHLDQRPINFQKFAADCWFGPLDVSTARFCDDDLAVGDVPISRASEDDFERTLSAASERHLAINWLVEGGELYSETDTST
jgi:hypothetical protein